MPDGENQFANLLKIVLFRTVLNNEGCLSLGADFNLTLDS